MRLATVLALALLLPACGQPDDQAPRASARGAQLEAPASRGTGPVVAEVGGMSIHASEFEAAASRQLVAGEPITDEVRQEIIDRLIDERALYLEARRRGIDLDPKVQQVMVNTLLRQEVYADVRNADFSEEELRSYFDTHREEFVVPEKVQIRRIFVRVGDRTDAEARALAEDLRLQLLQNPARFGELAREHSDDPYRRRGGDLGFVSREGKPGVDPEVVSKAFTLDTGRISEVFEAGGGYNVVQVANRRERIERTFEQMRGSVLRRVKNLRYQQLYDDFVAEVRGAHPVQVDAQALGEIEVEGMRRARLPPDVMLERAQRRMPMPQGLAFDEDEE